MLLFALMPLSTPVQAHAINKDLNPPKKNTQAGAPSTSRLQREIGLILIKEL